MNGIGKVLLIVICLLALFGPGKFAAAWPQKVVIGEDTDISGFDPALSESPFAFRPLLYNSLLELDLDFKITPGLAVKWQGSSDGKEWTFSLREGVKFHDGTPLDAQIVKKNFDRLREGPQKGWLSGVEEVIAQDRMTVRFRMKSANFIFDSHVTPPFLSIVAASAVDEKGKVVKAVGRGRMRIEILWRLLGRQAAGGETGLQDHPRPRRQGHGP
jgi:peptide/nickel transport system substrate-binding protein